MSSSASDKSFVKSLEALSEHTPLDDGEAAEILAEAGIDPARALAELKAALAEEDERVRVERFAEAGRRREEALRKLSTARPKRSRQELRERLSTLQTALPTDQRPQTFYRDLSSVPDEDLESLVAELEALVEGEEK